CGLAKLSEDPGVLSIESIHLIFKPRKVSVSCSMFSSARSCTRKKKEVNKISPREILARPSIGTQSLVLKVEPICAVPKEEADSKQV
ncbi:MAG: hypothetical protein ACK538_01290, partial [Armatimonadota bacterium]